MNPFQNKISKFYGYKIPPFNITSDPDFFFLSEHHKEALSHLLFGIHGRKGFIEITGEIGAGKTTLCHYLLKHLDRTKIKTAYIFNPDLTGFELLQAILEDLRIPFRGKTKIGLFRQLNKFLLNEFKRGNNVAVIIDEAQNLGVELLEELRMLSNLETTKEKILQLVLVGQPQLRQLLATPALEQLRQRMGVRHHILPLEEKEVSFYISHRLKVAGCPDKKIYFHPGAAAKIYCYSSGVPRLINTVCERALIFGFIASRHDITVDMISRCIEEIEGRSSPNELDQGTLRQSREGQAAFARSG